MLCEIRQTGAIETGVCCTNLLAVAIAYAGAAAGAAVGMDAALVLALRPQRPLAWQRDVRPSASKVDCADGADATGANGKIDSLPTVAVVAAAAAGFGAFASVEFVRIKFAVASAAVEVS